MTWCLLSTVMYALLAESGAGVVSPAVGTSCRSSTTGWTTPALRWDERTATGPSWWQLTLRNDKMRLSVTPAVTTRDSWHRRERVIGGFPAVVGIGYRG